MAESEHNVSVYERVRQIRDEMATAILDAIEKNPMVWERGWTAIDFDTPVNGKTSKAYKGFNSLYLYMLQKSKGYGDSRWVTFNQAKELGASVKKGEKSSPVLFYQLYDKNTKKEFNSLTVRDMTDEEKQAYMQENVRRILKYSTVFNAEQCDNFPERRDKLPEMSEEERSHQNLLIEQVISNSAAPIFYDGGNRAYYSPGSDSIHLPKIAAFHSMQDYYATALHEIAHSTGHESRLNRFGTDNDSNSYAIEELRAELASTFMQRELGITINGAHFENHAAYLNSWLNAVRNDRRIFFDAVRDAEKISDYVAEHFLQAEQSADFDAHSQSKSENAAEQFRENTKEKTSVVDVSKSFAEQVDAVLSGADTMSSHVEVLKKTPPLLRAVGIPNLRIVMRAGHVKSTVAEKIKPADHNHGLSVDVVKQLPELISDPIMIMDSLTHPNDSIVVVTQTLDKEKNPIIGAISINRPANLNDLEITANLLASAYGKKSFSSFLQNNLKRGTILYWDKEKSQELFETLGVQFPDNLNSLDSDTIIRKSQAFVNSLKKKNSENFSQSTPPGVMEREDPMADYLSPEMQKHDREQQRREVMQGEEHEKEEFMAAWAQTPEIERHAVKDELLHAERMDFINDETNAKMRLSWVREFEAQQAREHQEEQIARDDFPHDFEDSFTEAILDDIEAGRVLASDQNAKGEDDLAQGSKQGAVNGAQTPERSLGEELAKKPVWLKINLPDGAVGGDFGKSTLVRMPKGEYSNFGLFVDKKYLKQESNGAWTLTVGDKFNYHINNDGRQVQLSGRALQDVFSGKELGRTPERVAPSRKNKAALDRLAQNVPAGLKELQCWGVYFTTPPKDPNKKKRDKVLLSPMDGHWAKANEPDKWTDFDTAMKYARENNHEGLACLLSRENGITCIDLDECIDENGNLNPLAAKLTSELKGTYIEKSVSGNGLHIFLKDDVLKNGKYRSSAHTNDGELEVYDSSHIISMTGDMMSESKAMKLCPTRTAQFLRESLGERVQLTKPAYDASKSNYVAGNDNDVIARIRRSKKAPEFDALFSGKGLSGNASEDDAKLANMLAFFTDCDSAQCLRIMKQSGSYRPTKADSYYEHTINKAIDTLVTRPSFGAKTGATAGNGKKSGSTR